MTAIQEPSFVSLRHGGVYGRRWGLFTRRHTARTRGRRPWGDTVVLLAALALLVVLHGPSVAAASPVRREGPPPPPVPAAAPKTCPGEDIATKVNQAGKIFEGRARSRSQVKDGIYNVTFVVKHIFKGEKTDFENPQVRLQFLDKPGGGKGQQPECNNNNNHNNNERGGSVVKANIKRGKKYIVFVDKVGPHLFTPHGEPAIRNKENVQAVKDALCGAPLRLTGMRADKEVKPRDTLRLQCRARGASPQPKLHWYKDGVKLEPAKKSRIRVKKKRLIITNVRPEDAGEYECRAVTPTCDPVSLRVKVTVKPEKENTTTPWTPQYSGVRCPIDSFCLNGGLCFWYETIGEMACQCAEGYKGQRCDLKDVYNPASMYRHMSYFCKLGIHTSYYC